MGSFKKIVLPIFKDLFAEIKAAGLKRAMTFARILVDALNVRIGDEKLTKEELNEMGLMTKAQAHELAAGLIQDGLRISGGAADALIVAAVKSANAGVDASELGIKPEDEDPDDAP